MAFPYTCLGISAGTTAVRVHSLPEILACLPTMFLFLRQKTKEGVSQQLRLHIPIYVSWRDWPTNCIPVGACCMCFVTSLFYIRRAGWLVKRFAVAKTWSLLQT